MSVFLIILGLILFVGLVIVHEWGHYKAARKNGVDVEEFGLGFPPTVWSKKLKSGMLLSLNALPLGGFVRLKGEHDSDSTKGSFGAAPLRAKIQIMLAGVLMNLLVAVGLFAILAIMGIPKLLPNQFSVPSDTRVVKSDVLIGFIEENSPGEAAGLQLRDKVSHIISAESDDPDSAPPFDESKDLTEATESFAGEDVKIFIVRDGKPQTLTATLRDEEEVAASRKTDDPVGYLGVIPTEYVVYGATWSAPIVALGLTGQLTYETLRGLGTAVGNLIVGNAAKASEQVSGPVGIFFLLSDGSQLGPEFLLFIIAVISLTLAIMNVLPIPALDGGRLFVTLLFRVLKRPLTEKTEDRIHGTGFAVLMVLFVVITIVDVRRFF